MEECSARQQPVRDEAPLRILFVEDTPFNNSSEISLLKKLGCDVDSVHTSKECLAVLARREFDLVLMEIRIPDMSGVDTLRKIRRREQDTGLHLPVIALTTLSSPGAMKCFLDAGFDGYAPKPVDMCQFIFEMKRVLTINCSDRCTSMINNIRTI